MSKKKPTKRGELKKVLESFVDFGTEKYSICKVSGFKNPFVVMNPSETIVLDDGDGWGFKSVESALAMAKNQSKKAKRYNPEQITPKPVKTKQRTYNPLQNVKIEYFGDEVSQMLSRRLKELKDQNPIENDTPPW